MSDDTISRAAAISYAVSGLTREIDGENWIRTKEVRQSILNMPSAQPDTDRIYAELSKAYNVKGLPDEAIEIIGNLMLSLDE